MIKILAAADIHGDKSTILKLSNKAKKNNAEIIILAGDIFGALRDESEGTLLNQFKINKQKVFLVSGNWDSTEEIKELEINPYINNIDGKSTVVGDIGIVGIGNADWNIQLSKEDYEKIKKSITELKTAKKILVSHVHAKNTNAEFSGIPGDKILRKAIDEFKPDLVISGHIHEAEGLNTIIGKTKIMQVGRHGTIFEF